MSVFARQMMLIEGLNQATKDRSMMLSCQLLSASEPGAHPGGAHPPHRPIGFTIGNNLIYSRFRNHHLRYR